MRDNSLGEHVASEVYIDLEREMPQEIKKIAGVCQLGSCPAVYLTSDGDMMFQGYRLNTNDKLSFKLESSEVAIRLPKSVIDELFKTSIIQSRKPPALPVDRVSLTFTAI